MAVSAGRVPRAAPGTPASARPHIGSLAGVRRLERETAPPGMLWLEDLGERILLAAVVLTAGARGAEELARKPPETDVLREFGLSDVLGELTRGDDELSGVLLLGEL